MHDVVITGLGVISAIGNSPTEMAARFAAGEDLDAAGTSGEISEIPMAAVPRDKHANVGRLDRLCRFFLSATYLALEDAHLTITEYDSERVGLSFGTGFGCLLTNAEYYERIVEQGPGGASPRLFAYTVSSAAAGEVSIALGIKGPNVTAHMGFAAGLGAIGYAFDLIQMGKADIVFAGGADVIGPALLDALREMGLLRARPAIPFGDAVPGVNPSEGAMVAVLERRDVAQRRGARCWARIDGYAAGFEPTLTRQPPQCAGVAATVRRALELSGDSSGDVKLVMSSAHGTPIDAVERSALVEVLGAQSEASIFAPKRALGECFAASGVLSLALGLGLLHSAPAIADGLATTVNGMPCRGRDVTTGSANSSIVMVNALCYSGNVVTMVLRAR